MGRPAFSTAPSFAEPLGQAVHSLSSGGAFVRAALRCPLALVRHAVAADVVKRGVVRVHFMPLRKPFGERIEDGLCRDFDTVFAELDGGEQPVSAVSEKVV